MEIIIESSPEAASRVAARVVAKQIRLKPDTVLGLPTGSTPLGLYSELIRLHREEGLDFSRVTTFNLDEYVGLGPDHPASYHAFMYEHLFNHLNIPHPNIHIPNGLATNVPAHCDAYEAAIQAAGGIDLQILGVGTNGHIGFNEISSSLVSRTRLKTLTPTTRADNALFFDDEKEVPHHAITMGVGTIMDSRQCLLLAFGPRKAPAVTALAEGPITAFVTASILQMHPDAKVFIDEAAASQLQKGDYYRWAYANKPEWQQI